MKVFISWSGERSKVIAEALNWFLPHVINTVEPWVSSSDLDAGSRWGPEIATQLEKTDFGIICLTNDNLSAPWIHFEAGALSKFIEKSYVIPYLLENKPTDIVGPLSQFQSEEVNLIGTKKIISNLYRLSIEKKEISISENIVFDSFDKYWIDFQKMVKNIPLLDKSTKTSRTQKDLLEEILLLVRTINSDSKVPINDILNIDDNLKLSYDDYIQVMSGMYNFYSGEEKGKLHPREFFQSEYGKDWEEAFSSTFPYMNRESIDKFFRQYSNYLAG